MATRRRLTIGVLGLACAALLGGSANAAYVRVGTLVLRADGGFAPQVLPKKRYAPIRFQGYGKISTTNGSVPPALQHVNLDFDRDGRLATRGLPVCHPGRIQSTTVKQARRRCRGAIVGAGRVEAVLDLDAARLKLRSPLTLFNGPRQGRRWTVVAHAQASVPIFESYVVVVPVERRRRGVYGYHSSFDVPEIAGGAASLTYIEARIGRRYRFRGRKRSYVSARCSDGILQTRGNFSFSDGNVIYGSVFKGCTQR